MNIPMLIESKRGSRITGVRRVRYVFEGSVGDEHGPLELTSTITAFFASTRAPMVRSSTWTRPSGWIHSSNPLSVENRQFVLASGKWTAFDVSEEMPYASMIGQRVWEARLVMLTNAELVGVVFTLDSAEISAMTGPDDLRVHISLARRLPCTMAGCSPRSRAPFCECG